MFGRNVESITYALSTWAVGSIPPADSGPGWPSGALFQFCLVFIFDVSEPTMGKFFSDSSPFRNAESLQNVFRETLAISFGLETTNFAHRNWHLVAIEVWILRAMSFAPAIGPWQPAVICSRETHKPRHPSTSGFETRC